MKKPSVIIALIFFIAAGSVGVFCATGNLEGIVNKILHRSEVLDMSDEKNFDEILRRVKENLDEVESVRAEVKGNMQMKMGESDPVDFSGIFGEGSKIDFIFPDKKSVYSSGIIDGEKIESGAIVIGENIYVKFPFPWLSYWIHGMDGQSMPSLIPDSPGETMDFNLGEYPEGWDFTKNDIERIEGYLGVEEINGVKCYHYKVKIKSEDTRPLKKGVILEQVGDKIRYVEKDTGEEILISLPKWLTIFPISLSTEIGEEKIETQAARGEIWIGKNNFLVYKENYSSEDATLYYDANESGEATLSLLSNVFKNDTEITYSDFNGDIKIEAPTENVKTVDSIMEESKSVRIKAMDSKRKGDLLNLIHGALEKYYEENNQYPINNGLEKTSDKNCVLWDALIPVKIPVDPLDPEFYYTYKSDGQSYELVARLENLEDDNCVMENGICLYKCQDGICGK